MRHSSTPTEACDTSCPVFNELEFQRGLAKKLDAIIDSSFDGLWICDGEGKVIRINRASEIINDVKAEQVIGKKMETLIQEGLIDRSVTIEVLKKKTSVSIIQQLRNKKQILVTGNPVFDEQGNLELVVVNERDITTLNRLRNELEQSRALASRYRSELSLSRQYKRLLSKIIIRDEAMRRIFEVCMRAAQVKSTVLIRGESGVGKGFFAKLIHLASPRKEGPFIRVNCASIPESLIESELFGYDRGAFTGARVEGKPGHFELAEGGTLFLDEIGDLPLNVQVKLLRFLEENEMIRVGGTVPKKVDTRIIAATHRNLEEMVKKGEFRKDLFFRMNVIPIYIPPLRERREEIPSFVQFFLEKVNRENRTNKVILSRAIDCLRQYPFPGNIRELANLVEQLVVLTQNRHIGAEHLPAHVRQPEINIGRLTEGEDMNLSRAVQRLEKIMITRALKSCGTQRKAARLLGIDQSTLARKAKRYGIRSHVILHNDA